MEGYENLSEEDKQAYRVLEYQVAKALDYDVLEAVPAVVESIDRCTGDGHWGDVPVGHKYMTPAGDLYKLPSGVYVEVAWEFFIVDPEEAKTRIQEAEEENDVQH